ncbi:MAG: hypothetical protein AAF512_05095 [Pseudomonadota bacterium]
MQLKRFDKLLAAVVLPIIAVTCSAPPTPTSSQQQEKPTEKKPPTRIEHLALQMRRHYPLKLNVIIQGKRLDECEGLSGIEVSREVNTFQLDLGFIKKQEGSPCDPGLFFEHIVPLPLDGLTAGFYTVNANGLQAMFELPVDVPATTMKSSITIIPVSP